MDWTQLEPDEMLYLMEWEGSGKTDEELLEEYHQDWALMNFLDDKAIYENQCKIDQRQQGNQGEQKDLF